jgi:hypothetical protein
MPALCAWGQRLMGDLYEEALETLTEENCLCESLYLLTAGTAQFGMFVGIFDGQPVPARLDRKINEEHFRLMDAALTRTIQPMPPFEHIECIYHLQRTSVGRS